MPDLDVRTLSVLALISSLMLAAGLQVISRVIVSDPSLRLWTLGAAGGAAAYVLVAVRGAVYAPISIVVVNALMVSAAALMYLGTRSFRGLQREFPWYWVVAAATIALILHFTYLMPSLPARTVTLSAALAAIFFPSAFILLRPGDGRERIERWFVAAAYLVLALFMAVRAVATPFMATQEQDLMTMTSNFQKFSFAIGFIVNVALSMGLPLMMSGRLQRQLQDSFAQRQAQTHKLLTAFGDVISELAVAAERRIPHAEGHQRRVARLAEAIGRELEMDAGRIEGLRFAASIHDIGLVHVPVEILARPGRLQPLEFGLVTAHAQVGYDIVKGVDFPWPVADAIHQHHERLDGSGYPQGLKAEQIILEARILAVADVVEAMCSDRPHRAAPGVEAALKEIEDKRGLWFDPAAVDACLRVFREKAFSFRQA